jgi:small-conductance mechanosensitive channel
MLPLQQEFGIDPGAYLPALVSAVTTVVVFVVAFVVVYLIGKAVVSQGVRRTLERRGFDETLVGLAVSTAVAITGVFAVALAATIAGFGVVLAAFATLGGALALAVGFAARDLIANFVAGVFIIQDEPFTVGDWIEWGGEGGVVREIHLRVTKLDTFDNQLVTVPNADLANAAVVNNVANDRRRVAVEFGIGYADDIEAARAAIVEEAARIDGALDDPEPTAPVTALGDSAVVLSGRLWIDPQEHGYGGVRAQFLEAVKDRFDAEGIDMPYPHTELAGGVEVTQVDGSGVTTGD